MSFSSVLGQENENQQELNRNQLLGRLLSLSFCHKLPKEMHCLVVELEVQPIHHLEHTCRDGYRGEFGLKRGNGKAAASVAKYNEFLFSSGYWPSP